MFVIVSWLIHCSKCLSWNFTLFFLFIQNSVNFWMLFLEDCFGSAIGTGKIGIESATFPKGNQQRKHDSQRGDSTRKSHDSTPAAAHPISQKVHDVFLQSNNLFQGNAAMPFCFFVFLCLFHPFSIQSIAQRGILCVCLTVEPLHCFDLMFRVSFDNCTTCVPSSARAARTARTKVTDGYRLW